MEKIKIIFIVIAKNKETNLNKAMNFDLDLQ